MQTTTRFDTSRHHIHVGVLIATGHHSPPWRIKAIVDTGAPWTEVSDESLRNAGLLDAVPTDVPIPAGLQTQKYGRLVLPRMTICGQVLDDMEVKVSRFEETWGIDALVGLDFFRSFPVKIDYRLGVLEVG